MAIRHYHLDYGSIKVNNFPENEIQIVIPIMFVSLQQNFAIDSTGVKYSGGSIKIPSEMLKHAKKVVFGVNLGSPSATDAVVVGEFRDWTTATNIATLTFSGTGGIQETEVDLDTLKNAAGHQFNFRINVTTASATAGATQPLVGAYLLIYLGIS